MPAQRIADGEEDEPALFGFVDDLERDAGAPLDAVEEHVAVARLAHRAGRDGAHVADAVAVHDVAEALERVERGVDGLRADRAAGKRVAAEQDAARRLLDDA